MKNHILLALSSLIMAASASMQGRPSLSGRFYSVQVGERLITSVYSIAQDSLGFIWIGTDGGLVRYDGIRQEVFRWRLDNPRSICNEHVNAILYDDDSGKLFAGTDIGLCEYDGAGGFVKDKVLGDRHIKSLLSHDGWVWIGTTDGFFKKNPDTGETSCVMEDVHIATIANVAGELYFGGYGIIYHYRDGRVADTISLKDRNHLVLSIAARDAQKMLLGTEQGLFEYDVTSGESRTFTSGTPVKNFISLNDRSLLAGTDNGLYELSAEGEISIYRHETTNGWSLPNNVIWSTFIDHDGNLWIGTDHGVAMCRLNPDYQFVALDIKDEGAVSGLDITSIACSQDGIVWAAGTDGLMRCRVDGNETEIFSSNSTDVHRHLSHNKVRNLYDDGESLWIVSDGGLDRYLSGKVMHYDIVESTGKFKSSWMYTVGEDYLGRLWLGTYDGGLFIVSKSRLKEGGEVIADYHLSSSGESALSGNIIVKMVISGENALVVTDKGIDLVSVKSLEVSQIQVPDNKRTLSVAADKELFWIGTEAGVYELGSSGEMRLLGSGSISAQSMALLSGNLWVIDGSEIVRYDLADSTWQHVHSFENQLLSICADGSNIYTGSSDGFYVFPSDVVVTRRHILKPIITSLSLDNTLIEAGGKYSGNLILPEDIWNMSKIVLRHDQNSFALTFSDLEYPGLGSKYAYRLCGFHDEWQKTSGEAMAVFMNIRPGKYRFEVGCLDATDAEPVETTCIDVVVKPVWYATRLAYLVYIALLLGFTGFILNYIKVRNQLRTEHQEREHALEMVKMKSDFVTNVTHDLKSPLSVILGSVGKMVSSESDSIRSAELLSVQRNAEKIHLLVSKMLDFNGNDTANLFIPAAVSITSLAKEEFDAFSTAFADKGINARFVSEEIPYLFIADRIQLCSAFHNLLSNAMKFTSSGGTVLMSVGVAEQTEDMLYAEIKVEDTGCGIAEAELPYIFNQYYMASSSHERNPSGTGLGLYMVKNIVERHKGSISVSSVLGKGSCFTIRLSTMKAESFLLSPDSESKVTLHDLSEVWHHERRPIILLVEDNEDVRDLITASLGRDYVFLTASEGRSALALLDKEKIDLVITDLVMSGMDGLSLIRSIRNSLKTAFLPIVVLSGAADGKARLQCMEYADSFISKPFDMNYLNNVMIRLLIKHEQYLDKSRTQQMMSAGEEIEVQSADEKFLRTLVDIVNRHIDDPEFSAATLCSESRYPAKQVYRKLKQHTGLGTVEFIRDIRLQKAASLLSQNKLSVTEIMYMVGFTGASYFSKCFKARYGCTPSEYSAKGL